MSPSIRSRHQWLAAGGGGGSGSPTSAQVGEQSSVASSLRKHVPLAIHVDDGGGLQPRLGSGWPQLRAHPAMPLFQLSPGSDQVCRAIPAEAASPRARRAGMP